MYKDRRNKIDETIRFLEQAERIKAEELKAGLRPQFSTWMPNLTMQSVSQMARSRLNIEKILKQGPEVVTSFIATIKKEAVENPWKVVGKVAVVSLGIGLILGYHRRDLQKKEEK